MCTADGLLLATEPQVSWVPSITRSVAIGNLYRQAVAWTGRLVKEERAQGIVEQTEITMCENATKKLHRKKLDGGTPYPDGPRIAPQDCHSRRQTPGSIVRTPQLDRFINFERFIYV